MSRWAVGVCWVASVACAAAAAFGGGFVTASRFFERIPKPTRKVIIASDPERDREFALLKDGIVSLQAENARLQQVIDDGDGAMRRQKEKDEDLIDIAENAMRKIADNLDQPMWLRGSCKIHPRKGSWIVEGIVLESTGGMSPPWGYFWAVAIDGASSDPEVPYRASRVIYHTDWFEPDPKRDGEWVGRGKIKFDEDKHAYPKFDYDSPNSEQHAMQSRWETKAPPLRPQRAPLHPHPASRKR